MNSEFPWAGLEKEEWGGWDHIFLHSLDWEAPFIEFSCQRAGLSIRILASGAATTQFYNSGTLSAQKHKRKKEKVETQLCGILL